MIPIYDDNPALGKPLLVIAIIATCIIIFFWQSGLGYQGNNTIIMGFWINSCSVSWKDRADWTITFNFHFIYFHVYARWIYAFSW